MAGRFDTIADVATADELVAAVRAVVGSGARVAAEDGLTDVPPVAVLIQPMLEARFGGRRASPPSRCRAGSTASSPSRRAQGRTRS